ncbi:rho GTPase-activating protein 45 isoform X2 [Anabrus simplex]|uniref:rho GTPase-activating protein 45 isoform X2 n=1 Tax=Anabrus simplex TaxID=316456 RepID=UPI0034DD9543
MASVSSEGSAESPLMEQEDIAVLTHDVRNFKEALGKLRRTLNRDQDRQETLGVAAHERLGDVLRILRNVLEKYPALQSSELLVTAGTLIQHIKGYNQEPDEGDHKEIFELIDQLALAFSSRVSEYLMGDLDTSSVSSKTKSCENLDPDEESLDLAKEEPTSSLLHLDMVLLHLEQGVEFALNRAKAWSKYAKDIMMYVEKRIHLEMEYMRSLNKLALTIRPLINEESNLPFQSIYCTALDQDMDNSNSSQVTCRLLLGSKFLEPLSIRRAEHERIRRQLKEQWFQEITSMHDSILRMRHSRSVYMQRWQERNHKSDEDSMNKALESEAAYKASVAEANENHARLYKIKTDILKKVRQLLIDSDTVLQNVTMAYFQLQHTLSAQVPVQFQTLCESSKLYEPGSQYLEAVKQLPPNVTSTTQPPFSFEEYCEGSRRLLEYSRKSMESIEGEDFILQVAGYFHIHPNHRHSMSKAAETHSFRKLKTPSRCRECDSYVYFHGAECGECGLACHRKCLETLAIQCGHKRLQRKMTTFGVDLGQHLAETTTVVPHIVCKCIDEIDGRGRLIKGIYRVSGVKSKVEKLCQAFENGAELVDLADIHPNVIANVLKLYLRQLPEPLLTFQLYPDFIRIAKDCPSNTPGEVTTAVEELKQLVMKLPHHHFLTLARLMLHLQRVASDAHSNNMPPSNLGIVFGPTLLRTAEGSASLNSLVDTVHQTRAIELMIEHSEEIFNVQDIITAKENSVKLEQLERSLISGASSGTDKGKLPKEEDPCRSPMLEETEILDCTSNLLEDELTCFLSAHDFNGRKSHFTQATPKIFKGSLKDYQGLEGLPVLGVGSIEGNANVEHKMKGSLSVMTSSVHESKVSNVVYCGTLPVNQSAEFSREVSESENVGVITTKEWRSSAKMEDISKQKSYVQRVESSTDSDYSFETQASTSLESCSARDLEDTTELFLEPSALWRKKYGRMGLCKDGRHELLSRDAGVSLLSRSLDDSQGSDVEDVSVRRSVVTVHTFHGNATQSASTNLDQGDNIPSFTRPEHVHEPCRPTDSSASGHRLESNRPSSSSS